MNPRLPPFSIDAEQAVLGGMCLDNRVIPEVLSRVTAEEFYRADHQLLFAAISELTKCGKPADFVTVTQHLRDCGELDAAGGLAYVSEVISRTPSAAAAAQYADIVRQQAHLRELIAVSADAMEAGYQPGSRSVDEIIDAAEAAMLAIRRKGAEATTGPRAIGDLIGDVEAELERRKGGDGVPGLRTGLSKFDELTTGLHPGDLVILGARPSMGKTSLALNIAEHVALDQHQRVVVFSMEMPAKQLVQRMQASVARVPFEALRTGRMHDMDWDRVVRAGGRLRRAEIEIDETGGLSPNQLRARARRRAAKGDLGLIIVDYLQLMQVPGTRENRTNEISEISRSLKALAKELAVPVIALSQLNRSLEQRDNKRPRMSDLRESGGIEQDADLIVFIYRDEVYNAESPDQGTAELIIAKQRNGPLGKVRTAFLGPFLTFANLADDWQPIQQIEDPAAPSKGRGFGTRRRYAGTTHAAHAAQD